MEGTSAELRGAISRALSKVTGGDLPDDFIIDYICELAEASSSPMERALADVLVAYGLVSPEMPAAATCQLIDREIAASPLLDVRFGGKAVPVLARDGSPVSLQDWQLAPEDLRHLIQPGQQLLARLKDSGREFEDARVEAVNHSLLEYTVVFPRLAPNKLQSRRLIDLLVPTSLVQTRELDAELGGGLAQSEDIGSAFRPLEAPIRIADIREPVLLEPVQRRREERRKRREMIRRARAAFDEDDDLDDDGDDEQLDENGQVKKRWDDDPDPEVRAERERRIKERKQRQRHREKMERREMEKQRRAEERERQRLIEAEQMEEQNKINAFRTYLKAILSREQRALDVNISGINLSTPDGSQSLIVNADLKMTHGRRYGLIGRNGIGKSTLMRACANYSFDEFPRNLHVIHMRQEVASSGLSVLETVLKADLEREELLKQEAALRERLGDSAPSAPDGVESSDNNKPEDKAEDGKMADVRLLSTVYERMQTIDVWGAEARATSILIGLQFTEETMHKPVNLLSGGWRMRVALASALFVRPDILLLDEPTNHLDFPAVLWLEDYLLTYPSTVVVVSHDRMFLNNVCTDIIHFHNQTLTYYRGNFDAYEKIKLTHARAQASIQESAQMKKQHMQKFIDKFRFNAKRATLVQSRIKALERVKRQEAEDLSKVNGGMDELADELLMSARIVFPTPDHLDASVLTLQDVEFGYGNGPSLLDQITCMVDMKSRVGLLGANGIGKSTLLKVATGVLEPREGTVVINGNARIATFAQHHMDALRPSATPMQLLREAFPKEHPQVLRRHLGSQGLTGELATRRCATLSGGQKSRVAFALLTFKRPHFIVMDEPTNHLDLETVDALVDAVNNFEGGILLVSHDQHFLDSTCRDFWAISDRRLRQFHSLDEAKRFAYSQLRKQ